MPSVTLDAATIRSTTCPKDKLRIELFDPAIPGLSIEIRASGGKTYYLRYRDPHGRQKQYRIGDAKSITFDQAKKAAVKLRGQITLGIDPAAEKATLRQVPTFSEFIEQRYM
ncbi:Arm DNA-binding domain-containing protein, partial [Ferrovum myxofaciens]|uniref:Arm DNA-binding domain-containing protein n=1 Tax=Ferrovum myxofaciens TaxID=416213 RepID=UPI000B0CC668